MDYIPLERLVPCDITAGGFFAKGSLELKFRIGNYKTDEIMEYLNNHKKDDQFTLKIHGFKPEIDNFMPIFDQYHIKENFQESLFNTYPFGDFVEIFTSCSIWIFSFNSFLDTVDIE